MMKIISVCIMVIIVCFSVSCSNHPVVTLSTNETTNNKVTSTEGVGSPTSSNSETINTKITPTESSDVSKYEELLSQLNSYQKKYFDIQKDLGADVSSEKQKSDLFVELKSKIPQDSLYFKQYIELETKLSDDNYYKPDDAGDNYSANPVTVYSIQYEQYDNYLNNLYSEIKNKIPADAFSEFKKAETQWVTDKENLLKASAFHGDEDYPQTGQFKVDATKFRCLLLILYLS